MPILLMMSLNHIPYSKYFSKLVLNPVQLNLKAYDVKKMETLGYTNENVTFRSVHQSNLILYIAKLGGPPSIGRDWIVELNLSIDTLLNNIHKTDVGGSMSGREFF